MKTDESVTLVHTVRINKLEEANLEALLETNLIRLVPH